MPDLRLIMGGESLTFFVLWLIKKGQESANINIIIYLLCRLIFARDNNIPRAEVLLN